MSLPKGARVQPNGDVFFPKKGSRPPRPIQGYRQDKNDPWLFHTLYPPCDHRVLDRVEYPCSTCGKGVKYYRCALFEKVITFLDCARCEERTNADVSLDEHGSGNTSHPSNEAKDSP